MSDEFDNVVETVVSSESDNLSVTTSATYDPLGRKTSETHAVGNTRSFTYTADGQLESVTLPAVDDPATGGTANPVYSYTYDARGNQTSITDPLGRVTRFTYDERGNQTSRTLPDGLQEFFTYDSRNRLVMHTSFEGVVTRSIYDDSPNNGTGRLTEKRFYASSADAAIGNWSEKIVFTYDAFGRQTQTVWSNSSEVLRTEQNAYDALGRVVQVASPEGTLRYTYDDYGRRTSVSIVNDVDPDTLDTVESYSYDVLGRLASVIVTQRNGQSLPQAEETGYQYDLRGNLDRTTLANGVVSDYEYDDLSRLKSLTHYAPDETPELTDNEVLARFLYTVREDGKRTQATETFVISGEEKTNAVSWDYDAAGRLIDEVFDHYDDLFDRITHYSYDLAGNRVEQTVAFENDGSDDEQTTYRYDQNDRLLEESLDSDGDQVVDQTTLYGYTGTQQTGKDVHDGNSAAALTSSTVFTYNLQGRMNSVTVETYDGETISRREVSTYEYDTMGIRVSAEKVVLEDTDQDPGTELQEASHTRTEYLNDPHNPTGYSQVLQETEFDAEGDIVKRTIYTLGHDQLSQTTIAYDANGQPVGDGTTLFFGADGHGSTRGLFDIMGAIAQVGPVWQIFHFDAYGNAIGFDPAMAATSILYSGEMFDAAIALQYLRDRWYDAVTGRFNRLDSYAGNIHDPQSLHKYFYTHGDPVSGTDPSGRFSLGSSLSANSIGGTLGGLSQSAVVLNATRALRTVAWNYALYRSVLNLQQSRQQLIPLNKQKVRDDFQYALLAQASYESSERVVPGWIWLEDYENRNTGFFARLWLRNGERVLAFAGTAEPFLLDWKANIQHGLFGNTAQYRQAVDTAEQAQQEYGPIDRFVGHSLGGGLASAVALIFNKPATTFNAAGVNPTFLAQHLVGLGQANQLIDAYCVQGEILSSLQDVPKELALHPHPVVAIMGLVGAVAPDGVGTPYWLPGESYFPLVRHSMSEVLDGMRQMM